MSLDSRPENPTPEAPAGIFRDEHPKLYPEAEVPSPDVEATQLQEDMYSIPEASVDPNKKPKWRKGIAIGAAAATAVTAVVAGAANIFGNSSTHAVPSPVPSASAPMTPGEAPAPTSSPSSAETSTPTSTETPSIAPTESATSKPSESEQPNAELGLPSLETFQAMTPKEQLNVLEKSLSESTLSKPEMVYRRFIALEELIYNAPASDKLYKDYMDKGGLDYTGHIMDTYYDPLFTKLIGKKPSTNLEDGGALTFAYRVTNVMDLRYQYQKNAGSADLSGFPVYRLTMDVLSVEPTQANQPPYSVTGQVVVQDSIDAAQVEGLKNGVGVTFNVLEKTPVAFSMSGVHYDQGDRIIRATLDGSTN